MIEVHNEVIFVNDYGRGAHPKILEKLSESNFEIEYGYGSDSYSEQAKNKIREACGKNDAEIFSYQVEHKRMLLLLMDCYVYTKE